MKIGAPHLVFTFCGAWEKLEINFCKMGGGGGEMLK